MALEPDQFAERYCLDDDAPKAPGRGTKEGKEAWKEWFELKYPDYELTSDEWKNEWRKWKHPEFKKVILTKEDIEVCEGIAAAIKAHPMVSQMFLEGESEVTLYWIDKETDIICKARPDRLNQSFPCIPDIKSTTDASLESFEGDITSYDYHISAFWYLWGAKEVYGFDFENFVYVPCEKVPPFQVTFYTADEGSLGVAEGLCRAGLTIYKDYLLNRDKAKWKGFSLEPKSAGLRPYAFNKLSNVIHAHDLHGKGLEKFVGGI